MIKIFIWGINLEPKKHSYETKEFKQLVDKFSPKKKSPYAVELVDFGPEQADLAVIDKSKVVDFILGDLEKIEQRLSRTEDKNEKESLLEAQKSLEAEKLLFGCALEEEKLIFLNNLQLATLKPVLVKEGFAPNSEALEGLIEEALAALGKILFFTASEKEVKVWDLEKGKTVWEAAGKIHSDLKRGFIRAEIVNGKHLDAFFNMAEAKSKGLIETVGKDYIVESGDIIQIKFNV